MEITLKEMMEQRMDDLLASFLTEVTLQAMVDISFDYDEKNQWAVVTTFREDDELSLRLHSGDQYFLYIGYYDEKDDFMEVVKPLPADLVKTIPTALHKLMNKVLSDEDGMRVPGTLFSNPI
jgi:hypothetical protein